MLSCASSRCVEGPVHLYPARDPVKELLTTSCTMWVVLLQHVWAAAVQQGPPHGALPCQHTGPAWATSFHPCSRGWTREAPHSPSPRLQQLGGGVVAWKARDGGAQAAGVHLCRHAQHADKDGCLLHGASVRAPCAGASTSEGPPIWVEEHVCAARWKPQGQTGFPRWVQHDSTHAGRRCSFSLHC